MPGGDSLVYVDKAERSRRGLVNKHRHYSSAARYEQQVESIEPARRRVVQVSMMGVDGGCNQWLDGGQQQQ